MAIDYKAKDIRNIAHFRNCTGKWYTTVKESYSYLEKVTCFQGRRSLLSLNCAGLMLGCAFLKLPGLLLGRAFLKLPGLLLGRAFFKLSGLMLGLFFSVPGLMLGELYAKNL